MNWSQRHDNTKIYLNEYEGQKNNVLRTSFIFINVYHLSRFCALFEDINLKHEKNDLNEGSSLLESSW